jgi:dTDP-4-amino-4,6-dideoxygalactose transaminase
MTKVNYRVPFVDPQTHYARLKTEIDRAITDCLAQGDLVYRRQLAAFENEFAEFLGVKYVVGLNSGYHALLFALQAAGIGAGDEVITVAHTFVATVSAIVNCGAAPILVDVSEDYNMDPRQVERAITSRTRALLPVHLNGRVCDMGSITSIAARHGLIVIEDAAQALGATFGGAKAGTFGAAGCFSFYPFKILGGFGDGGALVTGDPAIARAATLMRYNGEDRATGEYHFHGQTALLDNVQAAVLSVKLRHLSGWIEHRRQIAELYWDGLRKVSDLQLPHFRETCQSDVFQNYVVRCASRDALREHLRKEGVETLVHWPKPMWEHRALNLADPGLPRTRQICQEVLSLPMSAETRPEQAAIVVNSVQRFFERRRS